MNAVFERDYVAFSSSWRFLLLRGGFAAGMGLLFFVFISGAHGGGDFEGVGSTLLRTAVGVGALLLALSTPGAFGTVLVHSRASGSLPVLFSTPLSPLSIAAGAFSARLGLLLLLVLATCPPLALALFYGGIRGEQILEAVAGVTAGTLLLGAPAFLVSAWARRTASAVVTAYLTGASTLAGLWLAGVWLTSEYGAEAGAAASPVHAVLRALDTTDRGIDGRFPGVYGLLLAAAALATIAVLVAAWRLDREAHGGEIVPLALTRRRCRALRYKNPVLDHELRRAAMLASRSPARGLLALLALTEIAWIVAVVWGGLDGMSINGHFGVLSFQLLLILLAVTAAGATALAQEKETNAIALLRAAPLQPSHVVAGKLAGVLRALLPCLVIPIGHLIYGVVIGVFHWTAVPAVAIVGTITMAAWATCALYQSLDQREPQRAVARTMTLLGIVSILLAGNIGWPLMSILSSLDEFVRYGASLGANPVAATLLPAALLRTGGSSIETAVVPSPAAASLSAGAITLLVWVGLHVVFGHVLYRKLARLYRTRFEG